MLVGGSGKFKERRRWKGCLRGWYRSAERTATVSKTNGPGTWHRELAGGRDKVNLKKQRIRIHRPVDPIVSC